jgi:anti-anti-sigma regulatory factor
VLDLAGVPGIDAAGVGELVRAYNVARAGNGALRIANTNRRVRAILERVGLFERLNAEPTDGQDRDRTEERSVRGVVDSGPVGMTFCHLPSCCP